MATETLLDNLFLKFFQAAALLKNNGWLAGSLGFFFLFLLAFTSASLYKASLINPTSNLRFLVEKCGLQFRLKSGT